MQIFRVSSLFCNVAFLCTVIAANISPQGSLSLGSADKGSTSPSLSLPGQCDSFVKQCFKTCFALGKIKVAYSCTYNDGIYGAYCGCGGVDQTNVALTKAGIPASTVTTTLQTTNTATTVVTDTSIASTQTTATATVQTSVCSYTTIASTILVTTTLTGDAATVTSISTVTTTSTTTFTGPGPVYTSAVPAAVVNIGSTSGAKRDLVARGANFCSEIQLACTVGCALQWSTPGTQVCQANAQSGQYKIACICKNKVNVVQKVIQNFNLFKPSRSQCTQITTTSVAATSTVTATSVIVTVLTNRVTVVPTTVVSVLTSTVTATMTYACPTTLLTTSVATATQTPTTTVPAIESLTITTTVTVATPALFYVAAAATNAATPSYVAKALNNGFSAKLTASTADAQAFVILQVVASDSLYNLVGVGPGAFNGQSLGLESSGEGNNPNTFDAFYAFFEPGSSRSQGPPVESYESAIWQLNMQTLAAQPQWTVPAGSSPNIVNLYGFYYANALLIGISNPEAFRSKFSLPNSDTLKFSLVPV